MRQAVRFIRKNGRVIPIAASAAKAGGTALAASGAYQVAHDAIRKPKAPERGAGRPPIKVNRALDLGGLGLSIASGALAAATFATPKGFVGGHAGAHIIDAVGVSTNVASVAGKDRIKDRAKLAARQELRNFVIGNAVYAAGVVGIKKNRAALSGYAAKVVALGRKVLGAVE